MNESVRWETKLIYCKSTKRNLKTKYICGCRFYETKWVFIHLLWINKAKSKDKICMWVSVLWKTTNLNEGIYAYLIHWVGLGAGTPPRGESGLFSGGQFGGWSRWLYALFFKVVGRVFGSTIRNRGEGTEWRGPRDWKGVHQEKSVTRHWTQQLDKVAQRYHHGVRCSFISHLQTFPPVSQ
jgi:hypothetical protein